MSFQWWLSFLLFVAFHAVALVLRKPCLLGQATAEKRKHHPQLLHAENEQLPNGHSVSILPSSLLLKVSFDGQRLQRSNRTLEAIMRSNIAKLYGNVEDQRIVLQTSIEDMSNQGSHATGLVLQIFGLQEESSESMPLPKPPEDMCFALNRMCHETIQVKAFAYPPTKGFHPRDFASVSYLYRISAGKRRDPIQMNHVWHLPSRDRSPTLQSMQAASNAMKNKIPCIHHLWCEQVHDAWSDDTLSYTLHIDLMDRHTNVLEVVEAIVDQPFAPAHGLVLTGVKYPIPIEWHSANRYVHHWQQ